MKILLAHNYYKLRGGEDEVFEAEASLLEQHGHDVIRWTRHNDNVDSHSTMSLAGGTIWSRSTYRDIAELCRREQPDVAHFHNLLPLLSPAACRAAAASGVPVVRTLHNFRLVCPVGTLFRDGHVCETCVSWPIAMPGILRGCYRGSRAQTAGVAAANTVHRLLGTWRKSIDVFIAPSRFVHDKLTKFLPEEKILIKPHFVPGAPSIGNGEGGYALFVGRLSPEKGVKRLLDAWLRHAPPLSLKIVGDGPLRKEVAAAAAHSSRVEWLGQQHHERVLALMGAATVVVSPSECYESFNRAVIDAYACGTPVMASNLGATAELVEDGHTGFLFVPSDAESIYRAVIKLHSLGDSIYDFRVAARRAYESRFSETENYRQLLAIYNHAMRTHQATDLSMASI